MATLKAAWTQEMGRDFMNMHGPRIPIKAKIGQLWKNEDIVYEVVKIGTQHSENEIILRNIKTDEKTHMIRQYQLDEHDQWELLS